MDRARLTRLAEAFTALTGQPPAGIWSAPGRVNLIGEHTDYNDGFVLPLALPVRTAAAAARRQDGRLTVRSLQRPGELADVAVADLRPGHPGGWAGYAAGVVWATRAAGHQVGGLDILIDGAVPAGSGLSSSAALECATALAVSALSGIHQPLADLAQLARHAENDFVGVPCGVMDQMAAMLARAGHVLFLDTRTGQTEHIAFDLAAAGLELLVSDTRVHHDLADSGYQQRFSDCAAAARLLGVRALRDVPGASLPDALARLAAEPELDTAVAAAVAAGALGARMTGGGFGGSAIALTPAAASASVAAAVSAAASKAGHPVPAIGAVLASAGARCDSATGWR